jgi:hypothetical protein
MPVKRQIVGIELEEMSAFPGGTNHFHFVQPNDHVNPCSGTKRLILRQRVLSSR